MNRRKCLIFFLWIEDDAISRPVPTGYGIYLVVGPRAWSHLVIGCRMIVFIFSGAVLFPVDETLGSDLQRRF